MSFKFKLLSFLIISTVLVLQFFFSNNSISEENINSGNNKLIAANMINSGNENSSVGENSSVNVQVLKSISKSEKGKAVDFTWEENGKTMSFSELTKDKVVFLNFWGTWCPPCRMEIPDIIQIDKEKNKDLMIISMALEQVSPKDAIAKVTKFATANKIYYRIFIGNPEIKAAYGGIPAVPTTFIIDKNGNIAETLVGMRSKVAFKQSIDRVLNK